MLKILFGSSLYLLGFGFCFVFCFLSHAYSNLWLLIQAFYHAFDWSWLFYNFLRWFYNSFNLICSSFDCPFISVSVLAVSWHNKRYRTQNWAYVIIRLFFNIFCFSWLSLIPSARRRGWMLPHHGQGELEVQIPAWSALLPLVGFSSRTLLIPQEEKGCLSP